MVWQLIAFSEIDGFVKNHQLNIDNPIDYQCFQFNLDLYDSFTSAKNTLIQY